MTGPVNLLTTAFGTGTDSAGRIVQEPDLLEALTPVVVAATAAVGRLGEPAASLPTPGRATGRLARRL
ncbi:hypothetical protein [Streptomyces sp. MST-110588]|uniref:hypothetical protein n=1 Tax=Streptomyces sp. MST-110588 TaxID=2833628 RepID=UPI001F5D0F76|nr:hypothetical protein [Streptomyces sp. MST-110588]UNO43401.1 hypothetical protein KGS77_32880 [Streptomyces sp. MST-110588]